MRIKKGTRGKTKFTSFGAGAFFLGAVAVVLVVVLFWLRRADTAGPADRVALTPVPSISYQHANHIHGLGYDGRNRRLFVATHYGLFVWKDGRLFQFGKTRDDYMGFSLHPSDPNIIYTSGHPQGGGNMGVMKSEDGGLSFQRIFRGLKGEAVDFHSMAISAANPSVLYGWFQGKLYRTKDGGKSWTWAAAEGLSGQGFCFGAPCFSPDGSDERTLYAGTAGGLFVSQDLGESWSAVNRGGAFAGIGVNPADRQRLFAFTEKFGLAVSLDGGKTWQPRNQGMKLGRQEFVFAFTFDSEDSARLFAATPERIFQSSDRGANWQKIL